jgi:hypothetical protein
MVDAGPLAGSVLSYTHTLTHRTNELSNLIKIAIGNGESLWEYISNAAGPTLPTLISLAFILEEHTKSLFQQSHFDSYTLDTITSTYPELTTFYSAPTTISQGKKTLIQAISYQTNKTVNSWNYYSNLYDESDVTIDYWQPTNTNITSTVPTPKKTKTKMSDINNSTTLTEDDLNEPPPMEMEAHEITNLIRTSLQNLPPETVPPKPTIDTSTNTRLRLNIIRHKYARSSTSTTLQLFQELSTLLKKADKTITILPIDSTKQQYTPISTQVQIDALTNSQLRLFFTPWNNKQQTSLSGFLHICSALTLQEINHNIPIAEWLDTHQYVIKMCSSQDEEMNIIGALCYGSLFLYREELLIHIKNHPLWIELNKNKEKPIILDLVVKPFRGSSKTVEMIFARAERSKKEEARKALQDIYDGTNKAYPRGDMLVFVPIMSKLEDDYTPGQRDRILYNHEKFIGIEDCAAIFGLRDLNTKVTLQNGKLVSLRTYIKCIPALTGMSRPTLFLTADPNSMQQCTIVTFQRADRPYIETIKPTISEILKAGLSNTSEEIFQNPKLGASFTNASVKFRGKTVRVTEPTPDHTRFVNRVNTLFASPPKTRQEIHAPQNTTSAYSSILQNGVQQNTTRSQSFSIQSHGNTTTLTHTSQTIMSVVETRFQSIETKVNNFDRRLLGIEGENQTISANLSAIMTHLNIPSAAKRRKELLSIENLENHNMKDVDNAHQSTSPKSKLGDKRF